MGCKKETDPIILVTSTNFTSPMRTGMLARFEIEAKSSKNTITRIEIKEYSSDYGYRILKDTLINRANASFILEYTPPHFSINQEVHLIFLAYNDNNDSKSVRLSYDYVFEDEMLIEYSGFSMYTTMSGKPDGFSIKSKQVIYTTEIEPTLIDFYSYQSNDTLIDTDVLQNIWKSYTNLNFVKFNGYNYSKSTRKSLTESYLSGTPSPIMQNIANDDIILIGFENTPIGVIKVVGVFDEEGYNNDRYIFNAKFIE